jgi:TctA family transporter
MCCEVEEVFTIDAARGRAARVGVTLAIVPGGGGELARSCARRVLRRNKRIGRQTVALVKQAPAPAAGRRRCR